MPLQSGCDKILKAMNRLYDTARFKELIDRIRAAVPDVAITTDIIVGFPGETEADFAQTLTFAEPAALPRSISFLIPNARERRQQNGRTSFPIRKRKTGPSFGGSGPQRK